MSSFENKENMIRAGARSASVYELSEEKLEALKSCLLNMAADVVSVCERNGIRISLAGGSALGAVRHHGFIPWDDDLDLMMPRSDYPKFCEVFQRELGKQYELVAPNMGEKYKNRFPKVFKRGTVFRTIAFMDSDLPNEIFLDIFLLENAPRPGIVRFFKGLWCNALMYASSRAEMYRCDNPVLRSHMSATEETKRSYARTVLVGKLFSVIPLRTWFDWVDRAVQHKAVTGYLGLPTGRKHYFGEIFPESVFLPFAKGKFEGLELPLPADCDAYLRNLYGDYMQIPPPEKRERRRSFILKDVRIFLNTVSRSIDLMKQGGIGADMKREETEDDLILTISIPKARQTT